MQIHTTTPIRKLIATLTLFLVPLNLVAEAESIQDLDCGKLNILLEQSGWQIAFSEQNDLILKPPGQINQTAEQASLTAPVAKPKPMVEGFDTLQQCLESAGWIVSKDTEGALLIYWPATDDTRPDSSSTGTVADTTTASTQTTSSNQVSPRWQQVQQILESTGYWRTENTDSGDLLIYPLSPATPDTTHGEEETSQNVTLEELNLVPISGLDLVQERLENVGWEITESDSGSFLIRWKQAAPNETVIEDPENQTDISTSQAGMNKTTKKPDATLILDKDSDGVPNKNDLCPATIPGKAVNQTGCEVSVIILKGIHFRTASSALSAQSQQILTDQAKVVQSHKTLRFRVVGHTDSVGTEENNLDLSNRRAVAVQAYLISQGVDASALEAQGSGEAEPIADNETKQGRFNNRRVELHMLEP